MSIDLRHDAEPTEEGKRRWPTEGIYYGDDLIIDGQYEGGMYHAPCTCVPECPTDCQGRCGCAACWLAEHG